MSDMMSKAKGKAVDVGNKAKELTTEASHSVKGVAAKARRKLLRLTSRPSEDGDREFLLPLSHIEQQVDRSATHPPTSDVLDFF